MLERSVNLKIEDAFPKVKAALIEKGCKLISEQPPTHLALKQGSLWGIAPQNAKKIINVTFEAEKEQTKILCFSKLSSDWKNITLVGCSLAAVLIGLCVWIALDLSGFRTALEPTLWSWMVTSGGNTDLAVVRAFVNLTWGLAGFLSFVIMLEAAIVVYVHRKIDAFITEVMK
jgi:hypothetical protein